MLVLNIIVEADSGGREGERERGTQGERERKGETERKMEREAE